MNVEVHFTAAEVEPSRITGGTAVVIDVIRATSTIVTALAHGARAIYPTDTAEAAIKIASSLGRRESLLCGERKGRMIEGFDLGNSPAEYAEESVRGKQLVMTTTNGTRAFAAAHGADRVVSASFLNLSAVVRALAEEREVIVICAGKEDHFSLDDAVCAGHLIQGLAAAAAAADREFEADDAARAAVALADAFDVDESFLRSTAAGRALVEIGLESDLALCARLDRFDLVPRMEGRVISVPGPSSARTR